VRTCCLQFKQSTCAALFPPVLRNSILRRPPHSGHRSFLNSVALAVRMWFVTSVQFIISLSVTETAKESFRDSCRRHPGGWLLIRPRPVPCDKFALSRDGYGRRWWHPHFGPQERWTCLCLGFANGGPGETKEKRGRRMAASTSLWTKPIESTNSPAGLLRLLAALLQCLPCELAPARCGAHVATLRA
jgi:hypothetical protein